MDDNERRLKIGEASQLRAIISYRKGRVSIFGLNNPDVKDWLENETRLEWEAQQLLAEAGEFPEQEITPRVGGKESER